MAKEKRLPRLNREISSVLEKSLLKKLYDYMDYEFLTSDVIYDLENHYLTTCRSRKYGILIWYHDNGKNVAISSNGTLFDEANGQNPAVLCA